MIRTTMQDHYDLNSGDCSDFYMAIQDNTCNWLKEDFNYHIDSDTAITHESDRSNEFLGMSTQTYNAWDRCYC